MNEEQPDYEPVVKTAYKPLNRPDFVPIIFKRQPQDQPKPQCAQPSDLYRPKTEDLGDTNSR